MTWYRGNIADHLDGMTWLLLACANCVILSWGSSLLKASGSFINNNDGEEQYPSAVLRFSHHNLVAWLGDVWGVKEKGDTIIEIG